MIILDNELLMHNAQGWAKQYFAKDVRDSTDQILWVGFTASKPNLENSESPYPMVVSRDDNEVIIQMFTKADPSDVRRIEFTLTSEDGSYVALNTRAFGYSEIWYQSWVARARFG